MVVPAILLLASVAIGVLAVLSPGPLADGVLLICAVSGIAALFLLPRGWFSSRPERIVLDGSNILYWKDNAPDLDMVRGVARWLENRGMQPIIWFDANVGYKVSHRNLGRRELATRLGLPSHRIYVAPKGTPADPLLLDHAIRIDARVVSNDRFRDWEAQFPRLKQDGFLVRTAWDQGQLTLKF